MTEIQKIEIKKLTLLERNPRKISKEQFEKLCNSLRDDPGFFDARPCLVSPENDQLVVYAGNQRVRAAKKLKWKTVPCIVEEVTEEIKKQRIIKDNKQYGEFDWDIMSADFEVELLLDAGFTLPELHLDNAEEVQEEKEDPRKKAAICPNCGVEL